MLTPKMELLIKKTVYFCFKLIGSRGAIKRNVLEVDKVHQEYLWRSPLLLGESSFTVIFFFACVGSEVLYSDCSLDCLAYIIFYFECKEQLSFEEHLSIIASDTGYRIIHILLTIE